MQTHGSRERNEVERPDQLTQRSGRFAFLRSRLSFENQFYRQGSKITNPRVGKLTRVMQQLQRVYAHLAQNQPLDFHGGSWRFPHEIAQPILLAPLQQLCQEAGIVAKGCKENLIETP